MLHLFMACQVTFVTFEDSSAEREAACSDQFKINQARLANQGPCVLWSLM